MRLRILPRRSRRRLSPERFRGRSRRFTAVQSALEALWSQGLALRMTLAESAADDPRGRATLRQWRAFVSVFLFENVCAELARRGFRTAGECDVPPAGSKASGASDECDHGDANDGGLESAEATYDACLAQLAAVTDGLGDADVLPAPLALDATAERSRIPLERVLAIKIRGIPRIA